MNLAESVRAQCEHQNNAKFADDDVPRRYRNLRQPRIAQMNFGRHLRRTEGCWRGQSPITNRRLRPPRQRIQSGERSHGARPLIERARVIGPPRVKRQLREPPTNSNEKKSREQAVPPTR